MEKNEKKEYIKPMMEEVPVIISTLLAGSPTEQFTGEVSDRDGEEEWNF